MYVSAFAYKKSLVRGSLENQISNVFCGKVTVTSITVLCHSLSMNLSVCGKYIEV